jgi:TonB family protein
LNKANPPAVWLSRRLPAAAAAATLHIHPPAPGLNNVHPGSAFVGMAQTTPGVAPAPLTADLKAHAHTPQPGTRAAEGGDSSSNREGQADGEDDIDATPYLPRSQLDQPSHPLDRIEIDYPPGAPLGEFNAVLLLFVDETGRVQRIRVREGSLPDSLERAAMAAFHAVRFSPGQRQGRVVKSLYPVAVNFSIDDAVRNAGAR